jgi:uncharacterized protein (DUF2235 family)
MPKTIIFCADGTWDTADSDTNVVKLYRAIVNGASQVPYYDDGVGSDGTEIQKLLGGAVGDGLIAKVQDGYTKIAQVYDAGDRIFIFGFSRGAYTARSLAGMIAVCGLPTGGFSDAMLNDCMTAYRNPAQRTALLGPLNFYDAKITMVGVWDTVGSLGIPALFGGVAASAQFLDTGLHPDIQTAVHAVSIDERREEFPATLWTGAPAPGQTILQYYFPGVHCDVGGGYPDSSLADITLGWMMRNAAAQGLVFDPDIYSAFTTPGHSNPLGIAHESWTPLWGIPVRRTIATNATLAGTAVARIAANTNYRPPNLTIDAAGNPAPTYAVGAV